MALTPSWGERAHFSNVILAITLHTVFVWGKCVCGKGMVKGKEVVGDPGGSKEP